MNPDDFIDAYLKGILEQNKSVNLTSITDYETARILHVQDSLFALPEFNEAPEGPYADIGTGGGFPGVPLGVVSGRETILVDSVTKKITCIDKVLATLPPRSITTYAGRIEDFSKEYPQYFAVVTARALSRLSVLMELASPLLFKGGQLIALKAEVSEEELNHALRVGPQVGMRLCSRRRGFVSDTTRTIFVFEKYTQPRMNLPRKMGFAQKKPL